MQRKPLLVVSLESHKRACGHIDTFKILKGEKAEYAAIRLKKWTGKLCQACNDAKLEKVVAEAREKRRVAESLERASWKKRLPDGSSFTATFDGENVMWTGTLKVPGCEAVEGQRKGCATLLHELARKWEGQNSSSVPASPSAPIGKDIP